MTENVYSDISTEVSTVHIRDVALHAGVSVATVSRVLNGHTSVRSASRQRVLRAVAELNYRPNRLARNLRRQTAETVAMVVSDIENPHFAEAVRAAEDAVYQRGYRLLLCNTDEDPAKQQTYLDVLADERVSGVIIAPSDPSDVAISRLLDRGTPIVAFDRPVADPRADAVVGDNLEAGRAATTHLLELAHTRIGFISGPETTVTGRDRLAGYEDAMRRAGLTPRTIFASFRIEDGERAAYELLEDPTITGLVVANNLMAAGALRALRARGRKVPDEVAFVMIDEPFWVELVDPPVTALAQPIRAMAGSAVRLLFERLRSDRTESQRLAFHFDLHVRASSETPAQQTVGG
jgi:DNA-binding LacI/PurR family transcriptional regulator